MDSFHSARLKVERVLERDQAIWEPLNMVFTRPELHMENRKKRVRSSNFTKTETDLLLSICNKYAHILENKRTDKATNMTKMKVWRDVALEFNNSLANKPMRDAKSLKFKYDQVKKDMKRCSSHSSDIPLNSSVEDQTSKGDSITDANQSLKSETIKNGSLTASDDTASANTTQGEPQSDQANDSLIRQYQIELLQIQIVRQRAESTRLQELHEAKKLILFLEMEKLKTELFYLKNSQQ